jgi:predicted ABC-type ATPase
VTPPRAIVIAGPNGAGKSSAAPAVLRDFARVTTYVNADVIAQGLSAFDPDAAAFEAGRVMLGRIETLIGRGEDFAFESTLSGVTARRLLTHALVAGYRVHLFYFWMPSVELSIERVRLRVAAGGHDVPEATIRRRFGKSAWNFWHVYRTLVTTWRLYDGSAPAATATIAYGVGDDVVAVDAARWELVLQTIASAREGA